jgi:GDPmannose 4,6-dehydratase
MKKVIVTGASGQDGSYMVEYLLKNTDNTIICALRRTSQAILSNLKNVLDNPRVKLVTSDLNDVHSITSLIETEKPDYFINFGASAFVPDSWNSPAQVMQTNAIALIHILEAVRKYVPVCRVYSAGSSEEMGDVLYSPQDDKHPARPRSIYGVSKATARMICKVYRESYGIYVVQGLLYNHESERRQEHYVTRKITKGVARIAKAIKEGKPFEPLELGNLDAKRDWSHAEDFVEGAWMMLNQESPREYILASNETHTVREFVEKAFEAVGVIELQTSQGPQGNQQVQTQWKGTGKEEKYELGGMHTCVSDSGWDASWGYWKTLVRINPTFYRPAEVEILHGDSSTARRDLGWTPKISFDELVNRMVKHDLAEVGL